MASQEEQLRLAAEVVDKFSGPLREMQKQLRSFREMVNATHKEGAKEAKEHAKAYHELREHVAKLTEGVKSGLEPALDGLGVGALGASAAIGGIAEAVRSFAGSSRELGYLSKETSLSIQALREFDSLARRIGSSPDAMNEKLRGFSESMEQLRRNRGPAHDWFWNQASEGTRQLGIELSKTTNNMEAFQKIREALDRVVETPGHSATQQREYLLEAANLPKELGRMSGSELGKALEEIRKSIGSWSTEDVARGLKAAGAFDHISESVEHLKDDLAIGLEPAITKVADTISDWVQGQDWKKIGDDIGEGAKQINDMAQSLGGWKLILEGIIVLKAGSWFIQTAKGVIELTTAVRALFALGAAPPWLAAILAAGSVLLPQSANEGEDELARQRKFGQSGQLPNGVDAPNKGLFHKEAYRIGDEAGSSFNGTGSKAELIIERAVFKGSVEGVKKGFLDAMDELHGISRGGSGDGFQNANYSAGGGGRGFGGESGLGGSRHFGGGAPFGAGKGGGGAPGNIKEAMQAAQDQLAKEGVPKEHLRAAAAALVGNAIGESNLNPNSSHDNGTGYGIYGARLGRASKMLSWLNAHGFAKNSLEGQMRYMAHEAMTASSYAATRHALMNASEANLGNATVITRQNFESPSVPHDAARLTGAANAFRAGAAEAVKHGLALREHFGHPHRAFSGDLLDHARRNGLFHGHPHKVTGGASIHVKFDNLPKGSNIATAMDGIFTNIKVDRGRAMPKANTYS